MTEKKINSESPNGDKETQPRYYPLTYKYYD